MLSHLDDLRTQARTLPDAPGVYFWIDDADSILYIGKAVNLRSRVSSYFSTARHERRVRQLLVRARRIQFEVTPGELEALFRESALIKQHQPEFNRALKVTRKPFYLKLDRARPDPYLEAAREMDDANSLYFGPFRSGRTMRETLAFLHDVLPLRKCTREKPKCRPCLYYQMGTCAAPALDEEHRRRHEDTIARLFDLLDGREDRITEWLVAKRDRLSEQLLFEQAADMQQRLHSFQEIQRRHTILEAAMQCRCVLVRFTPSEGDPGRLLLVAHGHVVSQRDAAGVTLDEVLRWVRAHDVVVKALTYRESPVDAASVLDHWIACNRRRIRWVALRHMADLEDVRDRIAYVVDSPEEVLAPAV